MIVTESAGSSLAQPDTVSGVFRVQEGGAVDLPCLARGQPLPSYTWYKVRVLQSAAECCRVLPSAANRLIGIVVQSRRRPILGPSPG